MISHRHFYHPLCNTFVNVKIACEIHIRVARITTVKMIVNVIDQSENGYCFCRFADTSRLFAVVRVVRLEMHIWHYNKYLLNISASVENYVRCWNNQTINRPMLINHRIIYFTWIKFTMISFSNAKLSDTSDYSAIFIRQSTTRLYNYLSFIIRRFVFLFYSS